MKFLSWLWKEISAHPFMGRCRGALCTSFIEGGYKLAFFSYPLILSVPIDTCMSDHTVCFSWPCDSNPVCGIFSPNQLHLPQRLLMHCTVALQANTFPWSCHVKCLLSCRSIHVGPKTSFTQHLSVSRLRNVSCNGWLSRSIPKLGLEHFTEIGLTPQSSRGLSLCGIFPHG